jgi:lipid-A-disaccharide synthase
MTISHHKCVMMIAGEVSGDHHGAKVVAALRKRQPNIFFTGIGGAAMRAQGVRVMVDADSLSVVGLTEIFSKAQSLLKGLATAKKLLKSLRPDLLILIDFPDFNLKVAAAAKKLNIPVLYYISPQIWAWRAGRVKKIKALVNHMAVILPFEADFYRRHQVPVTFVGHPLLDAPLSRPEGDTDGIENNPPVIGLLPGSRDKEIMRLLPEMMAAAAHLKKKIPNVKFIISLASSIENELAQGIIAAHSNGLDFSIEKRGVHHVFENSTLVLAASGTVTLEAAIAGVPMVIIYKVSPMSYWLGRALVSVDYFCLANLIAGKEIGPELLQNEASATNIANTIHNIIENPVKLATQREELLKLRDLLGGPGASERVADIAIDMMNRTK